MSPKLTIDYKAKNDKLVPGPGQYVSATEKLKQSAPSFGIGTSKRADIGKSKWSTPGPGSHEIPGTIGRPELKK